jgi:hypothetical protein
MASFSSIFLSPFFSLAFLLGLPEQISLRCPDFFPVPIQKGLALNFIFAKLRFAQDLQKLLG